MVQWEMIRTTFLEFVKYCLHQGRYLQYWFNYEMSFELVHPAMWAFADMAWHKYQWRKLWEPELTAEGFLDELRMAQGYRASLKVPVYGRVLYSALFPTFWFRIKKKPWLRGEILRALENPVMWGQLKSFLEEPAIRYEDCQAIEVLFLGLWRQEMMDEPGNAQEGVPAADVNHVNQETELSRETEIFALTWLIAVHLYYEGEGGTGEAGALLQDREGLAAFLDKEFFQEERDTRKLTEKLFKKKNFPFYSILNGKDLPKKGQLRPKLRQIMERPEIFTSRVAERARQLFTEHFMD